MSSSDDKLKREVNLRSMTNFLSNGNGGIDPVKLQQWNNFVAAQNSRYRHR